jgi:hypothetical protein
MPYHSIAYYLYKKDNPHNFVESYKYLDERRDLQKFTTIALLKRIFGGQPDNVLKPIREIIKRNLDSFPYEILKQDLRITNKSLKFTEEEVEDLLWTKYGNRYAFPVLSLLYPHLDYKNVFHQDHIFPRSLLRSKSKLRKAGLPQETIDFCIDNHDYIGNLQLIEGIPNLEKSNKKFDKWFDLICPTEQEKEEYRKRHLIPDIDLSPGNFEEFMEKREVLIKDKLLKTLL